MIVALSDTRCAGGGGHIRSRIARSLRQDRRHAEGAYPLLPRHRKSGILRKVYGNYLIFYVIGERVEVLHIVHGARNYDAILFPDE